MPVPTNLTAATALVIPSLPYSVTLDAFEVPSDSLWFRYDKVVGGYTALGLAAPVPLLTGDYIPRVDVYTGTADDLEPYLGILAINVPFTTPLQQVVLSYFFEVSNAGSPTFTEQLQFELFPGPVAAAPGGSFAINDDTEGFPMAIVSSTDGSVLQSFPFPAGERAGMLPEGQSIWHDQANKRAKVYDALFREVATVDWAPLLDHDDQPEAPMSASETLFYVGDIGRFTGTPRNAMVTTVTATGEVGATVWDLGAYFLWAIAPSIDDTILYYVNDNTEGPIKRWDLVNDVALSDLVAGVASYNNNRDLLVMSDGSVVHAYSGASPFVRVYSAAGATVTTIALASNPNRMANAGDGVSFWVWTFPSGGLSRFTRYLASDGTELESVDSPNSTGGIWQGASPGTPTEAHSTSCPFLQPPGALPPITFEPLEPVWGTRTLVQRRLRRAPHLSDEQVWMFYRQLQIDLQAGVGLSSGQGEDPLLMLRYSDDGGHTWSDIITVSAGRQGKTRARAMFRRLGRSRDRVFEVSVSDPVPWFLIDAYLDVERGTN